jgi:hypothetical protein
MSSDSESVVKAGKKAVTATQHAILPRHNSSLWCAFFTAVLLIILSSLVVAQPSIAYSTYVCAWCFIAIAAVYILYQMTKRWMGMDSASTDCNGATHLLILAALLFGLSLTLTVSANLVHYVTIINYICLVFASLGLGFSCYYLMSEDKGCALKKEAEDLVPMPKHHKKRVQG